MWNSTGRAPSLQVLLWHLPYNWKKKHRKTSVRVRKTSVSLKRTSVRVRKTSVSLKWTSVRVQYTFTITPTHYKTLTDTHITKHTHTHTHTHTHITKPSHTHTHITKPTHTHTHTHTHIYGHILLDNDWHWFTMHGHMKLKSVPIHVKYLHRTGKHYCIKLCVNATIWKHSLR
jgi:hypothetical protein